MIVRSQTMRSQLSKPGPGSTVILPPKIVE